MARVRRIILSKFDNYPLLSIANVLIIFELYKYISIKISEYKRRVGVF